MYRTEVIDAELYEQAIRHVFDRQNFTTQINAKGNGQYEVKIFQGPQTNSTILTKDPVCVIEIMAPGSRDLTSDIDTTLTINFVTLNESLLEASLLGEGVDYTSRLQASLIKEFNQLSQTRYKISSSLHRDSNAYTNGFLAEINNPYPVFGSYANSSLNLQLADDTWLLSENDYQKLYRDERLEKHRIEMAASLISLKQALSEDNWAIFKNKILDTIDNDLEEKGDAVIKSVKEDIEAIFTETEKFTAKDLDDSAPAKLASKHEIIKNSEYGLDSQLKPKSLLWEKDTEIVAMNELYVEGLLELAKLNHQLKQLEIKIAEDIIDPNTRFETKSLATQFHEIYKNLNEEKEFASSIDATKFPNKLKEAEKQIKQFQSDYLVLEKRLKEAFKAKAKLLIVRQRQQVLTNMFANEAYLNRSAPYHVVKGIQLRQPISKTKHVILGSILQQIGFYLLHQQALQKENYTPTEILYKLAKYGQRIADLMFGQGFQLRKTSVKNISKGATSLKVLQDLENSGVNNRFEVRHYELLKFFVEAALIKKNNIPDQSYSTEQAKLHAIEQLFENNKKLYEDASELLQTLAGNLIAAGYAVKSEKQGHLWGQAKSTQETVDSTATSIETRAAQQKGMNNQSYSSNPQIFFPEITTATAQNATAQGSVIAVTGSGHGHSSTDNSNAGGTVFSGAGLEGNAVGKLIDQGFNLSSKK